MRGSKAIAAAVAAVFCVVGAAVPAEAAIIDGSDRPNAIFGTNDAGDHIRAFGGADLVFAKRGNDVISAGSGNDRVMLGAGADYSTSGNLIIDDDGVAGDRLGGSPFADGLVSADGRADRVDCGGGDDVAYVDGIDEVVRCEDIFRRSTFGFSDDVRFGTNAGESVLGDDGSNAVFGKGGNDTVRGRGGSDLVLGGSGVDTIDGGGGSDEVYDDDGTPGDTVLGGPGADQIFAADGARDFIDCGDGEDLAFTDENDVRRNCEVVRFENFNSV